jgi:hypothetical protein
MHGLTLILAQAAASTISPEAQDLGVRLARTSGFAAIAPALIEKDLIELASENPTLSAEERQRLFILGRAEAKTGLERAMKAIGLGYARRLSVSDLQVLVAHGESPAAARWRRAEPLVIAEATGALGSMDLKKHVAAAFCRETAKLCDRK